MFSKTKDKLKNKFNESRYVEIVFLYFRDVRTEIRDRRRFEIQIDNAKRHLQKKSPVPKLRRPKPLINTDNLIVETKLNHKRYTPKAEEFIKKIMEMQKQSKKQK